MVKSRFVIGIDEVGRGPIAGPVCVAAFRLPRLHLAQISKTKLPLRDSKKLSKNQREAWFEIIKEWKKEGKCDYAMSFVSNKSIDKYGISFCIKLALTRSLYSLQPTTSSIILLDGGLKAPKEFKNQKTIIKGDEKEPSIALASIVAKVCRDERMTKLAKKLPQYGFEQHSGYGTKKHYKSLKKWGISAHHRKSYLS